MELDLLNVTLCNKQFSEKGPPITHPMPSLGSSNTYIWEMED